MIKSLIVIVLLICYAPALADPPAPKFEAKTIDDAIRIGYGVATGDVDGDGKPDIVAAGRATKNVVIYWNRTPAAK
jgi:hypothetical protein